MFSTIAILPNCNVRAMEGIISSLGKRGIPLTGLSTTTKCSAFYSKYVGTKLISPPTTQEDEFLSFLISEVPKGVLFASDDQTTLLFSKNAELLEKNGFLINIPLFDQLCTGFDKWLCYKKASSIGIPCALTHKVNGFDDLAFVKENMPYPFIFKATTLAGGNYVKVYRKNDVNTAYESIQAVIEKQKDCILNPEIIAQEWLEYDMEDIWCLEAYYDKTGSAKGFMPIQKIRTEVKANGTFGSRLYAGKAVKNSELSMLSKKLLDSLSWRGFAHFDWIYSKKKKKYYLTEINPRLPGFSFYPSNAGFEMAYFYYADLINEPFIVPKLAPSFYFEPFRYPGDISATISTIFRKQYTFGSFLNSYFKAFWGNKPVIVDFLDFNETRMTGYNFYRIATTILKEGLSKF